MPSTFVQLGNVLLKKRCTPKLIVEWGDCRDDRFPMIRTWEGSVDRPVPRLL